ncbi:MAG: hypothetical protein J5972_04075 [Eubacterium sp.]|nr:hypothetical protein [Eubacterium sp.]
MLKNYRIGIVMKDEVCLSCCSATCNQVEVFRYLELIDENGDREFVYEDEEGYRSFEENFMNNRFTSFHEFFTTEETAMQERGILQLKYYVRRGKECYRKESIEEVLNTLDTSLRLPDRETMWGKYNADVDYHM